MTQATEPIEPSEHHGENGNPDRLETARRILRATNHARLGESVLDLGLVAGIDASHDRVSVTLLDTGEGLEGVKRLWRTVRDALEEHLSGDPRIEVWIDWDAGWSVSQASQRILQTRDWDASPSG